MEHYTHKMSRRLGEFTTWLSGRMGRDGQCLFRCRLPAAPARPLPGRAAAGVPRQQALRRSCVPQQNPLNQDAKQEAPDDRTAKRQARPGQMDSLWASHQQRGFSI